MHKSNHYNYANLNLEKKTDLKLMFYHKKYFKTGAVFDAKL